MLPAKTSLNSTEFPLFAFKFVKHLCFSQTFCPFPRGKGSRLCQCCLKGRGYDVTYLWMTLIHPGAAWLSSKEKSWPSLLSLFHSSFKSCCGPPCQTLLPPASFYRRKLEKEINRRRISPALSLCFTHHWRLIYCLSDWLTHWLLADRSACSSLVNINVKVRQRQAGGLAAEKLT